MGVHEENEMQDKPGLFKTEHFEAKGPPLEIEHFPDCWVLEGVVVMHGYEVRERGVPRVHMVIRVPVYILDVVVNAYEAPRKLFLRVPQEAIHERFE